MAPSWKQPKRLVIDQAWLLSLLCSLFLVVIGRAFLFSLLRFLKHGALSVIE